MARTIATGIDVGTDSVKVVVAEYLRGERGVGRKIIGVGASDSLGLRHGYIVDAPQVTRSIRQAVIQAEKTSRTRIESCVLSVGGVGIESFVVSGSSVISRADSEISDLDLDRAIAGAQETLPDLAKNNRKILHAIPLLYKLDSKEVLGRVVGMKGVKLEVKMLYVTALEQHLADLIEAVERVGIEVIEVIASPIASAVATLTKPQRVAGCLLVDIGSETTSMIVYENDVPVSLKVFPIGSSDITNDIALGLRVPLDDAEKIKLGSLIQTTAPRKKLEDIMNARLKDIFELIETHLKKMGRNGLLPAGVTLTGGGSRIVSIEDVARTVLALPARVGKIQINSTAHGEVYDPSWTVAYGLALLGLTSGGVGSRLPTFSKGPSMFSGMGNKFSNLLKKFLP
mgnify:CR=1 FL=1